LSLTGTDIVDRRNDGVAGGKLEESGIGKTWVAGLAECAEQAKDYGLTVCAFSLVARWIACGTEGMPDRLGGSPARRLAALRRKRIGRGTSRTI